METTSLVPEDRRDEGYRSSQTESAFLKRAVDRGRASSCPNRKGFYLVSSSTGHAFEMNCKSWSCPYCSRRRRAVAVELIEGGMQRARFRGEWVRFLTLTAPPEGHEHERPLLGLEPAPHDAPISCGASPRVPASPGPPPSHSDVQSSSRIHGRAAGSLGRWIHKAGPLVRPGLQEALVTWEFLS